MAASVTVERLGASDRRQAMADDVRRGLLGTQPSIPPVWFYDEAGSRLFERITRLPEYYLTRAERSILARHARQIVEAAGAATLVEIGSGTSEKTRLLLDAMAAAGSLRSVVLMDISEEVLVDAAGRLADRYRVAVRAVVGDIRTDLAGVAPGTTSLWLFLGSTIGNFDPAERAELLAAFSSAMAPGDCLLLGTDLVKPVERLKAAYDDAEGVTAAFNLNVLAVLDRELDADFDPDAFEHVAVWNQAESRIEMRLRATRDVAVHVADLGIKFALQAGEDILTELSSKFEPATVGAELEAAGLHVEAAWTDDAGDFLLTLARRAHSMEPARHGDVSDFDQAPVAPPGVRFLD